MNTTPDKPALSVVILNFNGRKVLETSLPSLVRQTFLDFEVILVDNGSTDDSLPFVSSNFPSITVVNNGQNSFSSGNNAGIRCARGAYVLVVNNDVELDVRCLDELMSRVRESPKEVGMWAPKILNYYTRNVIDSAGLSIYPDGMSRGRGRLEVDTGQYDAEQEVLFPSGCAGLYKKEMLDRVGLFDEDFEFYAEDVDLGFRARLAGWKCFFSPKAKVYHMYSATGGSYSPRKAFLVERNRSWMALKNFPLSILLLSPFFTVQRYLYQLYSVFAKRGSAGRFVEHSSRFQLLWVVLKAWCSSLFGLRAVMRKRKRIQGGVKASGEEIRSWFKKFGISAKELALTE